MSQELTLELDGLVLQFDTVAQVRRWWRKERLAWAWVWETPFPEISNIAAKAQEIDRILDNGTDDLHGVLDRLRELFEHGNPHLNFSGSIEGQRALNVRRLRGNAAAARFIKYSQFPQREYLFQQHPHVMYEYISDVAAAYAGDPADKVTLTQERRNFRHAIEVLEDRVRELETEHDLHLEQRSSRMQGWIRAAFKRARQTIEAEKADFETRRDAALSQLEDTHMKYTREMAFKAPVTYWQGKAKAHNKWQIVWAVAMVAYFIASGFGIFEIAANARNLLTEVEQGATAVPSYIIISGATLGATTLLFWLGRLIVKLFLSEHHLVGDANEKAVMMQAFLAMENRGDFKPEERAIVLASIFRSTPDGIVREEGPTDVGFQAAFSRVLMPRGG